MWKLSKIKGGILEISTIRVEFEDTFSSVHLRDYYIKKYGLRPPCRVDKVLQPTTYKELSGLITDINLFKPREEVPNKTVTTDVPGCSKLIRNHDKTMITLCYRKGGEYCQSGKAKSNNTCYISEPDSFDCYHSFDVMKGFSGKEIRVIKPDHPSFKYWSDFMDREYARLAGVKYQPKKKPSRSFAMTDSWKEKYEEALSAYANTKRGSDLSIIEDLAENGYCKINDKKTSLYDKNGIWICELEEFLEKDGEAYMIRSILWWLTEGELWSAKHIFWKYLIEDFS